MHWMCILPDPVLFFSYAVMEISIYLYVRKNAHENYSKCGTVFCVYAAHTKILLSQMKQKSETVVVPT